MNKKKFCKIFFPVLGTVAVVTGIYWALIEFSLKDLQNIGYISFRYEKNSENKNTDAYITAINQDKNYPSYFEVPKQLKGHKVVGIDAQAFYGLNRLKTVVLPKSVSVIGDQAFGNCVNLKKVIVKGELTSVGVDVFEGSDNWEYKSITDENGDIKIVEINKSENSLEDILLKENEIENIQNTIYSLHVDLKEKNICKLLAIIFGLIFIFVELPISICQILEETNYLFLALLKITPFIFEGIIPFTFVGNPITFAKNLRKLKEKIKTTEKELKDKQEELESLKKVSEFKERDESFDMISSKKEEINPAKEIEAAITYSLNDNNISKGKVRVLRLVPKNNVQEDNK